MKSILKLEELAQFLFGIFLFSQLEFAWWWFIALLFLPDVGMIGYLVNLKIGAITYNIFHHKGLALALYILGIYVQNPWVQLCGIILFSHSALDRMLGYGLKYDRGFKFTHLGTL